MTRDTALGLAFQRLDVGDAFKQQYYDLTTLSLRHYYGIDDWRKDKNVAPQPQVESDWLAWADKGRAEIERGLYYGIIAGGESARIKEDSPYHKLDIPFDGVGGITMFGYGLPFKHRYYVGVEGYIGRSGAVFRPHDETGSSYDNLYMSTVYKDSYYKDYYYGGRLLLGILNSNANLAFIHAGTVQADWSIITASGINKAPKYRDRYGKFFFDNSAELAGKGYLQTDGVMVGMGHEIPITSKLFIRMEYDYTHFSQASEKPSNTISASKDYTYTYHPQSDQFLLGMKYRLGSKRGVNWRGMASRYSTGWYVSGAIYDDFHHITQKFGVTEPSYVNWSAGEAEIFGSHKVPKDFFADGLAGQMQLSHRWMRHVGEADIMLGLEGGFAVLNSQYSYQRKQYFVYTDPNTNVPYDTPSLDFSYRFVNKGSLGGLMGYQVNAEDMLMFKVDFVSTLVKRTGFEKDFRPAAVSPEQRLRSFGRNFSRRIEGWQFTLSNDFAMTRSLGLTLGCSFTRYGSFRIEDENILISHGDNKTVKNHYYGYRVTDMGYLIGLRYRLG